ncbi:SETMAR [Cordylochernes scorpioides]|uniref:SETMAR n=1 Tax=Cordylochernes scorpioides TaxID=51811 RepID=A0ABY6KZV0_9ARAC|nr:SETMAR [Cordylochernes scorpioides]
MAISEPKSTHLREVLLFTFNWKKSATEAYRMLEEVYGDHALSKSQCYRWYKKFQSGNFVLDNEPRGKPPQKFEDAELTQTQEKLAKQLQVSQGAVSLRLNSLGITQKLSRWAPHELSERQQERRLVTCEGLLARHEKKSFLHRIKSYAPKVMGLPGQFPKQTPRPNCFGKKAMLCVWWDQTGVVYFEFLKPGETVNTSRYEQQMHSLREAVNEKRPEWRQKHNKLILQHDNAPAQNATEFSNSDILRKWLVDWFDSKGIEFFRQGIRKLPERWSEKKKPEVPPPPAAPQLPSWSAVVEPMEVSQPPVSSSSSPESDSEEEVDKVVHIRTPADSTVFTGRNKVTVERLAPSEPFPVCCQEICTPSEDSLSDSPTGYQIYPELDDHSYSKSYSPANTTSPATTTKKPPTTPRYFTSGKPSIYDHRWKQEIYEEDSRGALNIRNRQHQTTLTRFRTSHLKPLKIENNNKIYPTCPKCSLAPAAPEHILACIRCTKQDLWERPLLIIKQLEEHELMELVWNRERSLNLMQNLVEVHRKHILMKQVCGTLCLSKSNVFIWHKRFSDGRNTLEDDKHTGRPSSSKTPESIEKVREFVANNRNLGKTKVCAKFVPHTLMGEQKSLRIAHCRDIISAYEND